MSAYTPDEILDLVIDQYMLADEESVCNAQPTTYFNACWPEMWSADTVFSLGETTRPPTDNGFIYECTIAGTGGAIEPVWATVQDATFSDGAATWKAHENYALINATLNEEDKVKGDGPIDGRAITIAQKMGVLVHTDGVVSHTALIDNANKKLKVVTTSSTSLDGDNSVLSGRTTLLHELVLVVRDPAIAS